MTDLQVTFWNVKYDGNCKKCGRKVDLEDKDNLGMQEPYCVFAYGKSHTVLYHGDCMEKANLAHAVKSGEYKKVWP